MPVMYGTHRSPACLALHHLLYAPVLCVMQQLHWLASYLSIPKHFSLQLGCIILITIVCFVNNHQICSVPSERVEEESKHFKIQNISCRERATAQSCRTPAHCCMEWLQWKVGFRGCPRLYVSWWVIYWIPDCVFAVRAEAVSSLSELKG